MEFTTQVLPKSSAMCNTTLISSSMKPAPRKSIQESVRVRGATAVAIALALAGCSAAKPILYPNAYYASVGPDIAQRDIMECRAMAEAAGARPDLGRGAAVAGTTALGALVGAASGAVGGAVVGEAGSGAGIGAASGATANLLYGLIGLRSARPSDAYVNFVNLCLANRGYQIAGWD